jgi:type II secretory pathway component PulL
MPPSTELLMPTDVATETVGEWTVDVVSFEIEPNPWFETIYMSWPRAGTVDVTQVVVDTICMPEPATLAMLAIGFGGLAFLRRR